jgi:hypothetical protein
MELHSPDFVFRLDTRQGLRAVSWENRLTGRTLDLGRGAELELELGLPGQPLKTPVLGVERVQVAGEGEAGEVTVELRANDPPLSAAVNYRWNAQEPVLRKNAEIRNLGHTELNRLLNVRLADYHVVKANPSGMGWQGFPLYLDEEFFVTLAHPSGWAAANQGRVELRQHPGVKLGPTARFACMEAVCGVGRAGRARQTFLDHLRSRMRRVVRKHDRPYAIFEPFGARPGGDFNETETFVLDNIAKLARGQHEAGYRFDFYSVDFWVDYHGDLKKFDPQRFPNGLASIRRELARLGTAPGLWIDSGGLPAWTIGGNPAVRPAWTDATGQRLCRATEPLRSMYVEAFRHHLRANGVRLLKFDNLNTTCDNPSHEHLPGIYSTEAIENAVIEFLHALDAECPDVFLMLYWGHRSPWWLVHADTLFDSGIGIEAASPSSLPAPHARDSVTQRLDQAQWHARDVPPLGKDSLGIWLSSWPWNSSIGTARWQEGFVMDMARGSLLAQPWSDDAWLSPPERKQMAEFIALLRARPECFGKPRFILGDPWKDEPYGYCCTDGNRAFLAIYNCCWEDRVLALQLNAAWGLPNDRTWDLYRWYPERARLRGPSPAFGPVVSLALRPFEVVLLEAVPAGESPSLNSPFDEKPIPTHFAESSRALRIRADEASEAPKPEPSPIWTVLEPEHCVSANGATLTKRADGSILASGKNPEHDTYTVTAKTTLTGITAVRLEALPDRSFRNHGPGRAVNGNFALTDFRLVAAPQANPAAAVPAEWHSAVADYSQTSYGGWPVEAAIDRDVKTGWSIDPEEGVPHSAVFQVKGTLGFSGGTVLTFTLSHQGPPQHNLGLLRLSVTTAKPPIPPPRQQGARRVVVCGELPPCRTGGTLVLCVEMSREEGPMWLSNVGSHFTSQGTLSGQSAAWQPVLGALGYPAPWQAWRLSVGPSAESRPFELRANAKLARGVRLKWTGHFVAQ